MNERILIIGGGVTGLMLKGRLEKLGYSPILAEKAPILRAQGAGLLIGANVVKIFREIGLETELLTSSQTLDTLKSVDESGKGISYIDMAKVRQERSYATVALHRQKLHDLLTKQVNQNTLWLDAKFESFTKTDKGYEVHFSNKQREHFDRIIACDGIHSKVRSELFGDIAVRHTRQGCWRFIMDMPKDLDPTEAFEMWGDQKRVGIFPIANNRLYCFMVATLQHNEEALDDMQVFSLFETFQGPWNSVKRDIKFDQTTMIYGELADISKITLCKDGILLIGDAGHSTTPNLGQGAAMGIESAYTFSRLLETMDFDRAIEKFCKQREPKVTQIRNTSFTLGRVAHIPFRWLQALRNGLFRCIPQSLMQKQFEKALFDSQE